MRSLDPRAGAFGLRPGAAMLATVALSAGCVTIPADEDPVLLKIGELESRLSRLESRLETDAIVDMASELARLQDELRVLRGEVDVSRNDVATLAESQRTVFVQLDNRMTTLEAGGAAGLAAGAAAAGVAAQGVAPVGDAGAAAAAPPGMTDRELYDRGFDLLKQQQYAEAGDVFAELVRSQPESSLAGAALYWYGETFYVQRDFDTALVTFERVLAEYPRSNKTADALLKAGFCNYELGQWQQARDRLSGVTSRFAGTPAARLAAERLDRMSQEGR
jgi:tol-pal system protein YbgF